MRIELVVIIIKGVREKEANEKQSDVSYEKKTQSDPR